MILTDIYLTKLPAEKDLSSSHRISPHHRRKITVRGESSIPPKNQPTPPRAPHTNQGFSSSAGIHRGESSSQTKTRVCSSLVTRREILHMCQILRGGVVGLSDYVNPTHTCIHTIQIRIKKSSFTHFHFFAKGFHWGRFFKRRIN